MKIFLILLSLSLLPLSAQITVTYTDPPGFGFNDSEPRTPVGGNTGTTLGEQRRIVMEAAIAVWDSFLVVNGPVEVSAEFAPQQCTPTSGVLASAGTTNFSRNFPGAPRNNIVYPASLMNHLSRSDRTFGPEITVTVNSNLDSDPNCLGGRGYYYGLDNLPGNQSNLLGTLTHELGHGLGFQAIIDTNSGAFLGGTPDVYSSFIRDLETDTDWQDMTNAQRLTSSRNAPFLVWTGENTAAAGTELLSGAVAGVGLTNSAGETTEFEAEFSMFGNQLILQGVSGQLAIYDDGVGDTADACEDPINAAELDGMIVLVDRGSCNFDDKVFRAQQAGAIGVIIVNNVTTPIIQPGGDDIRVTIPSLMVSLADGAILRAAAGDTVRLGNSFVRSGTREGLVRLFGPSAFQPGSSISHFDQDLFPNSLMEPFSSFRTRDDPDLALTLMREIGWEVRDIPFPNLTFELWATQEIAAGLPAGPDDDADNDGFSNFIEYAKGTDPTDPNDGEELNLNMSNDGFSVSRTNQATDLTFVIEDSDDLLSFDTATGVTTDTETIDGELLIEDFSFDTTNPQRFFRLSVEQDD